MAAQGTDARRSLSVISFDEAANAALERGGKPLVKGLLDQGALSVLYGPSNVGKTFVALDLALHVATGLPWSGMGTAKCRGPEPVNDFAAFGFRLGLARFSWAG